MRTSLRISNASATMTHVTLWTDQGIPTYGFDVYLVGYDTTDIDMRLLFKGIRPITASDGQDTTDYPGPDTGISNQGPISQDINFASCNGILPYVGLIDPATVTALRNAHTGQASTLTGGLCGGRNHGDNIARGYVTVDVTNACTELNPDDPGYFDNGGGGIAGNRNIIVGTVTRTDPANNFASSDPAIHIEASPASSVGGSEPGSPITNPPGESTPTFYGRLIGWSSADNREPLGSVWQARFLNGGAFDGGTKVDVWRDSGAVVAPFACGTPPVALSHYEATFVDEQENVESMAAGSFPLATQSLDVAADLQPTATFGFMHLNLNASDNTPRQSAVSVRHDSAGRFSGSVPGVRLFRAGLQECSTENPTDIIFPPSCTYYRPEITGPVGAPGVVGPIGPVGP